MLYAEGGKLCCGTASRSHSVLVLSLAVELFEFAGLANVKLRLGRLDSNNQQKGVDALIYRDLMTLAQHRAISDAVLLSGDEDLREGVRAAQDYGVRVVLVGIACADRRSGVWLTGRSGTARRSIDCTKCVCGQA